MIHVLHLRLAPSTSYPFRVAQALFDDAFAEALSLSDDLRTEPSTIDLHAYYPDGPLVSRFRHRGGERRTINIPLLRELMIFCRALGHTISWRRRTAGAARASVATTNYPPAAMALRIGLIGSRVPRIVTLTDLGSFSYSPSKIAALPAWRRVWTGQYSRLAASLEQSFDGYILLTAAMDEVVNPRHAPSVVVEAIYNPGSLNLADHPRQHGRVIAHAGTLDKLYGVQSILDAFAMDPSTDSELWLFGRGDMEEEIQKRAAEDPRITYFGFVSRDVVFEHLKKADLLVNLRDPRLPYTRYSFPSKMLEYMVSGTPVATTRLTGIPEQYWGHLYPIDYGAPHTLAQQLSAILALDPDERRAVGEGARQFVLERTSARTQGKKIHDLIRAVVGRAET